jgi:hypothetical protein
MNRTLILNIFGEVHKLRASIFKQFFENKKIKKIE